MKRGDAEIAYSSLFALAWIVGWSPVWRAGYDSASQTFLRNSVRSREAFAKFVSESTFKEGSRKKQRNSGREDRRAGRNPLCGRRLVRVRVEKRGTSPSPLKRIGNTCANKGNPAFRVASFLQGVVALAGKASESAKVAFCETAFLNKEPEFE